jgi:cysteinyl-tRNA synthetase
MSLDAIARFGVETLDAHCGGVDLIFPHHEDEIAQSEAATGQPFARHWLHGAFLNVKGTKMSKRYGNFLTVRDLQDQGIDPGAFRHLVFSTHYRQELDVNDDSFQAARQGSRRLRELRQRLDKSAEPKGRPESPELAQRADEFMTQFSASLDDDLNAPRALAATHDFAREANRILDDGGVPGPAVARAWTQFAATLDAHASINARESGSADHGREWAEALRGKRDEAKRRRDFAAADRIRAELRAAGWEIRDSKDGTSQLQPL